MENEGVVILSIVCLIISFVSVGFILYQQNQIANLPNSEDIITLQNAINANNANAVKMQDQLNGHQTTINRLSTNYASLDNSAVEELESDVYDIEYCSKRYNDADEFEDFADCIKNRLD